MPHKRTNVNTLANHSHKKIKYANQSEEQLRAARETRHCIELPFTSDWLIGWNFESQSAKQRKNNYISTLIRKAKNGKSRKKKYEHAIVK